MFSCRESTDLGGFTLPITQYPPSVNNPRSINIKIGQHILAQGVIFLPHYIERSTSNFEVFLHMLSLHIFSILRLTYTVIAYYYTVLFWMYSFQIILENIWILIASTVQHVLVETSIKTAFSILNYDNPRKC